MEKCRHTNKQEELGQELCATWLTQQREVLKCRRIQDLGGVLGVWWLTLKALVK